MLFVCWLLDVCSVFVGCCVCVACLLFVFVVGVLIECGLLFVVCCLLFADRCVLRVE